MNVKSNISEVQYLYAYEQLLKAKYEDSQGDIIFAELMLETTGLYTNGVTNADAVDLQRYAENIFDIEKSLFV